MAKIAGTEKDPRQYIDTYFGTRNGIKGVPVENVNYTLETLTYMTPKSRGDEIVKIIGQRMHQLGLPVPFIVFECCAGIGGNTLSFLDSPTVQWVASYEIVPERKAMLIKNVEMYGLGSRSYIPEGPFQGIPNDYKGSVLYFDPPWLPSTIKGDESTKEDYVLHGIKVGDKTLEQWIDASRHASMIVIRVPPGYKLDPVPGFTYEQMLLGRKKNSLLIIAYPTQQLQEPQVGVTPGVDPTWYNGLRDYLMNQILPLIVGKPEQREMMVSPEMMNEVWIPCFTHESFDPNVGNNYEELEFVGDHAMEYNFIMYLYLNYKFNRAELSQLKSHYMSKPFQAKISLMLGLNKWVRFRTVHIDTHTFEDILEALFGAINIVGDRVFKFGAGNGLCFVMMNHIFSQEPIDMQYTKGKPKTVMKETFEQLKLCPQEMRLKGKVRTVYKPYESYEDDEMTRTTTMTISLCDEGVKDLRELGIQIDSPILAVESGNTKKVATDNAYQAALNRIRALGMSEEWVEKIRGNRDINNPELAPLIGSVQNKLKSEGYDGFYLSRVQQDREGKYYQLIGIRPDNTKVILSESDEPLGDTEAKKVVLIKYVQ